MTPQTNYFKLWRHQDTSNNSRKTELFWEILCLEISKSWTWENLKILEKVPPTNPEDPSDLFLKILKMGSISSKKHEMDILDSLGCRINILKNGMNMLY